MLPHPDRRRRWLVAALWSGLVVATVGAGLAAEADGETVAERPADPWQAYANGRYDRALEGFLEREVEHPEDPRALLDIGSAQYKLGSYAEAEESFRRAAGLAEVERRARALYNLGNAAYRQGRLPEAIDHYRQALDLDPEDEDAKFNLEFVEQELERRRQQQQQQQQQQQREEQEQQQDEREQDGSQQGDQGEREGEDGESSGSSGERDDAAAEDSPSSAGPDSDGDGLPDRIEREGSNPTDPRDPDSDDDGLPDGLEDADRDGELDPGETDPNRADSDGDGTPDGRDSAPTAPGSATGEAAMTAVDGMSPEEAARYLEALEEGRPERTADDRARASRSGKDW